MRSETCHIGVLILMSILGKFNYPDEFVLSDTSALQNLFVHGTRNKMQQGGQALPPTRDPSQVLSPRASKARLTKAEVDEIKGTSHIFFILCQFQFGSKSG